MYRRVFQHRLMLSDEVRVAAYRKAIHEVVKRGDVVADIGTGSGILAFLAVQAGAKIVYAIEQNEIIKEAEKLAKINGLEKKIVFIKGRSDRVELPEKVDVIISELIGFFGLEENLLRFKIDTRERFLKPRGKLIPNWLELYVVPVESESIWKEHIGVWNSNYYGFDFSPVRSYAVYGLLSAKRCAQVAVKALEKQDFSENFLSKYQKFWTKDIGLEIEQGFILREIFLYLNDEEINELMDIFGKHELLNIVNRYGDIDYPWKLALKIITKKPKILIYLKKYIIDSKLKFK